MLGDYELKTTFWQDFSIADMFGKNAIKDTYKRASKEWKKDYIYLTELVMVLNWKCWQFYDKSNEEENELKKAYYQQISQVYCNYYNELSEYALNTLKGDKLSYYLRITD